MDKKCYPMPTGDLQGDDKAMPDKGTSRGWSKTGHPHLEGADTGPEATNRMGGFRASSDSPEQSMPKQAMKGRC